MKFRLSQIRSKSRQKSQEEATNKHPHALHSRSHSQPQPNSNSAVNYNSFFKPSHNRPNPTSLLPTQVLTCILVHVCPHVQDHTYITSEDSMNDGGCMLCDMRDLAQCALVSKEWHGVSLLLLYRSVRIDAVHYCERELNLAATRQRRSFFERNGNSKDAPQQRLELFARTVRDQAFLAAQVQYLKISYMTRESSKPDLARTISVLPNLRYVDLPEGFYNDDPSANTLKQELQSRCHDIRSMKYQAGAERSFATLAHSRYWQNLETLEVSHLHVEPNVLVHVLSSLPALHYLKLANLPLLDDSVFKNITSIPRFPPVARLSLEDAPKISVDGLVAYLSRPETRKIFFSLQLSNTAISPSTLYKVLAVSPYLSSVHVSENITRALPTSSIPPLASHSLKTLHFELSSISAPPNGLQDPSESYYAYLASSIMSGALPSLMNLYALSPSLPNLLLPLPLAPFGNINSGKPSYAGVVRPLDLYTKSIVELEWNLTSILPPTAKDFRGKPPTTRPVSLYNAEQLSPKREDRGRDSVMVGNGFGGYLEVPSEEARPGSSSGKNRTNKGDAWMG